MKIYFTYQQPERVWKKSGCANNIWLSVDNSTKEIDRWTSCYLKTEIDIAVSKADLDKLYQSLLNDGYKDISKAEKDV